MLRFALYLHFLCLNLLIYIYTWHPHNLQPTVLSLNILMGILYVIMYVYTLVSHWEILREISASPFFSSRQNEYYNSQWCDSSLTVHLTVLMTKLVLLDSSVFHKQQFISLKRLYEVVYYTEQEKMWIIHYTEQQK